MYERSVFTQTRYPIYRWRKKGGFQGLRSGGLGNNVSQPWKMRKVLGVCCGVTAVWQYKCTRCFELYSKQCYMYKKKTAEKQTNLLTLLSGEGAPDLKEIQEKKM
jgi:hypothetical protein